MVNLTLESKSPVPLVFQAVPYALGFALPLLVVASADAGGWWILLPMPVLFGAFPLVDALGGARRDDPDQGSGLLEASVWFRLVTWMWVPVQLWLLARMAMRAAGGAWSGWELAGVAVGVGICTGAIGMTYAHELIHRASRWERALGEILLSSVGYPHFAITHVLGHHRTVATPLDPQTARHGESFYRFLPRAVWGGLVSALQLESGRVERRWSSGWSPHNRFWRYLIVQAAIYGGAWLWLGPIAIEFLVVQSAVAISELEVTNYIEHYGLQRREVSTGAYERVQPWHSWDNYSRASNWLLINLARHSDHHLVASRRYQVLETQVRAPELPAGYAAMLLAALVPPLWFRLMNPRLAEWRHRHQVTG